MKSRLLVKLKKLVPVGSFARHATVLAAGTAVGQGLMILASPLLTRLYTPDDFGVLAVYASLLNMVAVIATLRYEVAIPLPEDEEAAASLLVLSISFVLLTSILFLGGTLAFARPLTALLGAPALMPHLWLLPLGIIAVGSYQALNYWSIRRNDFGSLARTKLNQGIGGAGAQVILGLLQIAPVGLLIGQVIGQGAGVMTLATRAVRSDAAAFRGVTFTSLKRALSRYRRFPLLSSWPTFLNSLTLQLPVVMLTAFYSPVIAGWFILTQRALGSPFQIIGKSVAQVFFGKAAKLAQSNPVALRQLFFQVGKRLAVFSLIPFALLALGSPSLFAVIFGEDWREAGVYLRYLIPMIFAQFVISPIASLNVIERQDLFLYWNLLRGILSIGGFYLAYLGDFPPGPALGIYSLGMTISYLVLALFWLHAVKKLEAAQSL